MGHVRLVTWWRPTSDSEVTGLRGDEEERLAALKQNYWFKMQSIFGLLTVSGNKQRKTPNKTVYKLSSWSDVNWNSKTVAPEIRQQSKLHSYFPPCPSSCLWLCSFAFCCQKQKTASGALNTLIIIDFSPKAGIPKGVMFAHNYSCEAEYHNFEVGFRQTQLGSFSSN